jgi:hypothetical protein
MKCQPRTLASGEQVLLYSNMSQIVLQLRRQVPTEEDLLEPSFKVAVSLTALEAAQLAKDLLNVAHPQIQASTGENAHNTNSMGDFKEEQ